MSVKQIVAAGDSPRVRANDPETSHAAAESISFAALEASEVEVLVILDAATGPMTDAQIERAHAQRAWQGLAERIWSPPRLRTARKQLVDDGKVARAGEGRSATGRRAGAWVLTERSAS